MRKSIRAQLGEYRATVTGHVQKLIRREEKPKELLTQCIAGVRKLAHEIAKSPPTEERKSAIRYVKRGVQEYNAKRYDDAVHSFRKALSFDANYARAHTYLGNALYKRGHVTEAVSAWQKAVEVDPESEAAAKAQSKLLRFGAGAENILSHMKEEQ